MSSDLGIALAEFARRQGYKASYVTKLRQSGRLVLDDSGKVLERATLARLAGSADPAKAVVAQRHAEARRARLECREAEGTNDAMPAVPPAGGQDAIDEPLDGALPFPASTGYSYWRERTERAKALAAERDNAVADGRLLVQAEVQGVVSGAITRLRTALEALPYELAPELAAIADESQVRARLTEAIETQLNQLARTFSALQSEGGRA